MLISMAIKYVLSIMFIMAIIGVFMTLAWCSYIFIRIFLRKYNKNNNI
jgi:hypothetical protein